MQCVRLDQLQVGDLVARDVLDVSGKRLVSKGAPLTARHLRALRMWGTESVWVEGVVLAAEPAPKSVSPIVEAQAREAVARLFRCAPVTHPVMSRLFEICVERQLASGW